MRLSHLCTSSSFFQCEHGIFAQTKGAPIGGPLSGLLGDLVIENLIERKIGLDPKWGPIWDWIRMADDTFLEWTLTPDELTMFHNFLNHLHPTKNGPKRLKRTTPLVSWMCLLSEKDQQYKSLYTGKHLPQTDISITPHFNQ